MSDTQWIHTKEACRILGIHLTTLYRWIKAGKIEAWQPVDGGKWFVRLDSIKEGSHDKAL